MGQAAGTAAALAAARDSSPRELDPEPLLVALDAGGADYGQRTAIAP